MSCTLDNTLNSEILSLSRCWDSHLKGKATEASRSSKTSQGHTTDEWMRLDLNLGLCVHKAQVHLIK